MCYCAWPSPSPSWAYPSSSPRPVLPCCSATGRKLIPSAFAEDVRRVVEESKDHVIYELDVGGRRIPVRVSLKPLFDPAGEKIRLV